VPHRPLPGPHAPEDLLNSLLGQRLSANHPPSLTPQLV
jgi:hypothetical protein